MLDIASSVIRVNAAVICCCC